MTDYSKMDWDQISKLLGGGETKPRQIGAFNQSSFRTDVGQRVSAQGIATKSTVGGKSMGGGYCAGVCLDWARRVLLKQKSLDSRNLTYGYGTIKEGKGTKAGRSLDQSKERSFQTVGRMGQAWHYSNDASWTEETPGSKTYALEAPDWAGTAASIDSYAKSDRATNQRNETKKPFSSLVLLGSKKANYTSPDLWMGALLSHALSAGAVSKLDFNLQGASGHAVAVWQRKTSLTDPDSYYFFDPNYGVFTFDQGQLQNALQVLFWFDDDDTPHYDTCSSKTLQRFSWTTFGPPKLVGAQPNHVNVVHSPPVTSPSQHLPQSPVPSHSPPQPHSSPPQPHFTLPQPAPIQPPVFTPPVNAYSSPALGLVSPGIVSAKAPVNVPQGSGKHAALVFELETFKATGKILTEWGGLSYAKMGGIMVLKEPLKKKILANNPWKNSPLVVNGVQSAIDVESLDELIALLRA